MVSQGFVNVMSTKSTLNTSQRRSKIKNQQKNTLAPFFLYIRGHLNAFITGVRMYAHMAGHSTCRCGCNDFKKKMILEGAFYFYYL